MRRIRPSLRALLTPICCAFIAIMGAGAVTIVGRRPDVVNEYVVVHEITLQQALHEAKAMPIYPGPKPGCKPCTSDEMSYCRNNSVIDDHCICDPFSEPFKFVEHSCKLGPHTASLTASNCAEYSRVRDCCCDSYLASVWKHRAGEAANLRISQFLLILAVLLQLLEVNR